MRSRRKILGRNNEKGQKDTRVCPTFSCHLRLSLFLDCPLGFIEMTIAPMHRDQFFSSMAASGHNRGGAAKRRCAEGNSMLIAQAVWAAVHGITGWG